jgi:hypothetical protein
LKPNWFDLLLYRVWYWRWNKIFASRSDLREIFIANLKAFDVIDEGTKIKVTVTIEKDDQ